MVVHIVMLTMDTYITVTRILLLAEVLVPARARRLVLLKTRSPAVGLAVVRRPRKLVPPSPRVTVPALPKVRNPAAELVVERKPRNPVAELVVERKPRNPVAELVVERKPRNLVAVPRPRSLVLPRLLVEALVPQKLKSLVVVPVVEAAVGRKPRSTKNPRRPRKVT